MLFAALLFSYQGDPSPFDQKISIDARGVDGIKLGRILTQKTGIRFETLDEATSDRYVIHIENAPLRDALTRIADAESGEWMRLGDNAFRLRRSPERMADARRRQHEECARKFTRALEKYRKQLAERQDFSDEAAQRLAREWRHLGPPPRGIDSSGYWQRQNRLEEAVPVGRAFMRILLTFNPDELADIPTDRKTVFCTNPTAMQRPFSDNALDGLNSLVSEQIVWEDAVSKYLPEQANQGWNGMATAGKIRKVSGAIVTMSRWDRSSGIQAQLMLYDNRGRILTETYMYLDDYEPPQAPAPTEKPAKPEPEVPLSEVDQVLAKVYNYNEYGGRSRPPVVTEQAKAILIDPEKFDPTSTFLADGLIGIAAQRHENIAAVVDDRVIGFMASAFGKKGVRPQVLNDMGNWGGQSLKEGGGWLVMYLKEPDRSDEVKCDRHALRLMLDDARAQGRLTLDTASSYAITSERFNENPIPQAYLNALLDKQGGRTLQENEKNVLRFYGSLDAAQRAEEELPMARLNGFQIGILEKMVYGSFANLQETSSEALQPDENGEYYGVWNTTAREPTVSLPNGIPRSGHINIKSTKNRAIVAHMQYGDWDQGYQTYDANSLGWMIANREFQPDGNLGWNVLGMRAADRTQITFDFDYTEKIRQTMSLQDVLPTTAESNFVEKLPDDLRRVLQKAIEEAKKQYAQGGGVQYYGGFGGANGAPP